MITNPVNKVLKLFYTKMDHQQTLKQLTKRQNIRNHVFITSLELWKIIWLNETYYPFHLSVKVKY